VAGVTTLERGLKILDLMIDEESDPVRRAQGVSIQQVAMELEVHTSTASRLMQSLVNRGYATSNQGARRGFRFGSAVAVHAGLSIDRERLGDVAQPFLLRLVDVTSECAHVAVASGASAPVIDDVETRHALRVVAGKGRQLPLHRTSAGKCLLAFELAPIPGKMPAGTARAITSVNILKLHLADIVDRGYAFDGEENDVGVRCILLRPSTVSAAAWSAVSASTDRPCGGGSRVHNTGRADREDRDELSAKLGEECLAGRGALAG
jgi:IclR family acetate operon transcriptional repressor